MPAAPHLLTRSQARRLWLRAQRLDEPAPFGDGPEATRRAVEHLGYVQIDTINVIERCHHHILFTRIPGYQRAHLRQAQSLDKSVFEYWTHALSYVPTRDICYFLPAMRHHRAAPRAWFATVSPQELRKVLSLIKRDGPLTIRDIDDDVLVEKDHPWASRKPSKRALQLAFYSGLVTVNERLGMLKSYELTERHFGWETRPIDPMDTRPRETRPRSVSDRQIATYLLERAVRAQGIVSVDSVCYLDAKRKSDVRAAIDAAMRRRELVAVRLEGSETEAHWVRPEALDLASPDRAKPANGIGATGESLVHILSPFDPLVIQRKRLHAMFGYEHRFEAYVPKDKRVHGYFALPVLIGDAIVAAIDLKTDRKQGALLIQQWTWTAQGAARAHKRPIEEALDRFARFQLAADGPEDATGANLFGPIAAQKRTRGSAP